MKTLIVILLAVGLASGGMQPASASEAKPSKSKCGLRESGFTYFPASQTGTATAQISWGLVVRNRTKKPVVDVDAIVNFYSPTGNLVQTETWSWGLGSLAPRDRAISGDTEPADGEISSMKVWVTCATQSKRGRKIQKVGRKVPFSGQVTKGELGDLEATGTFRNPGRTRTFEGTPTFIYRNSSGGIIGGDNLNTGSLGTIPRDVEIRWSTSVNVPFKDPLPVIEGTVSPKNSWYS